MHTTMAAQHFAHAATVGLLCSLTAVLSTDVSCPVYYYYDHGTDKCEFCCDLCCQAELKGTAQDCEQLCPGESDSFLPFCCVLIRAVYFSNQCHHSFLLQ